MSRYIPETIKAAIRAQANDQCGYCRSLQQYVLGILEIEHIIPTAAGGTDEKENLWLSCRLCNGFKGSQTHGRDPITGRRITLFNPRTQKWSRHFEWSTDGAYILRRTQCGRATVEALQLNNSYAIVVREAWISAGWHPPKGA